LDQASLGSFGGDPLLQARRGGEPFIFLMGPTATGKTSLAVELVEHLPLEIISVDSAMVYRGMDIGTGKPEPEVLSRAAHGLIDIRNPTEPYSAAEFAKDALQEASGIRTRGKIPLFVGGTGLYFQALTQGLSRLPSADSRVRAQLSHCARLTGWPALHARLRTIDPEAARRIHPHDAQRIQRALEVFELAGRCMTDLLSEARRPVLSGPVLKIVLEPAQRDTLHQQIADRLHGMIRRGFIDEVRHLRACWGGAPDLPSMRAVGYRQIAMYLDGRIGYTTMVAQAIGATRQLAKRQLTWLRSEPQVFRLKAYDAQLLENVLDIVRNLGFLAVRD
jgi:tRNA dimethylallyltransferase